MKYAYAMTAIAAVLISSIALAQRQASQAAAVFPMHDAQGEGDEQVRGRGQGKRANRWIGGNYASALSVTLPEPGPPTAAVVICPGGGYTGLAYDKEGTFIAKWMNQRGVAAGVLKYRTGGGAHQHPAPRDDVQLALQTMRAKAAEFGYPADKIGVMGFSAGGHLAATAATQHDEGQPQRGDAAPQDFNSRPDFAVLIYPVISMQQNVTHGGSRQNLLGRSPTAELVNQMSADQSVTSETPPTFLVHATDDGAVPVENALRYYRACVTNKVPAELHVFEQGGHGFGMWREELPIGKWPELLEAWMLKRGLMAD